jgi:hypothetical protein
MGEIAIVPIVVAGSSIGPCASTGPTVQPPKNNAVNNSSQTGNVGKARRTIAVRAKENFERFITFAPYDLKWFAPHLIMMLGACAGRAAARRSAAGS